MLVIVDQTIVWYRRGIERLEIPAGPEPVEVDDDLGAVALAEGWARAPGETAATPAAPENKDAAPRRARKG